MRNFTSGAKWVRYRDKRAAAVQCCCCFIADLTRTLRYMPTCSFLRSGGG